MIQFQPQDGLAALIQHTSSHHGGKIVLLCEHRLFDTDTNELIAVPEGFRCDLASVPWLLRGFYTKLGPWARAAVFHDYLYRVQPGVDRLYADQLFRRIMKHDKVIYPTQLGFSLGVRLGGSQAWKNNKKHIDAVKRNIEINRLRNKWIHDA